MATVAEFEKKASGFFNAVWGGLKDSYNYIDTFGGQPYLICRKLKIKSGVSIPYWYWYKEIIDKKSPKGFLNIKLPATIEDVGLGKIGKDKFVDFIWGGKKVVVRLFAKFMTIEEEKTAYKLTAEKEKVTKNLKTTLDSSAKSLQGLGGIIITLKKKENELNSAQKKVLSDAIIKYNKIATNLGSLDGIKLSTSKLTYGSEMEGIGVVPVVIVVVAIAAIALSVIAYFSIDKILNTISNVKKYHAEAETQITALTTLQKGLENPNLTEKQKQDLIDKTYETVKESKEIQKEIIKKEEKEQKQGLFATIKTVGILAVVAGGLVLVTKLIPSKK